MENTSNTTSEQELLKMRDEGKINESEYQQLLSAMQKPSIEEIEKQKSNEPEFKAFRKRVLTGSMIICAFGLPIGVVLNLPYVWIMSILGLIIGGIKLRWGKK
ncbi:MAG: hypothetical protein JW787_16895 [Sedimentisphaerales bacterium]|nr:hypothetical protein [Sedimentisphaerales bacterium]